MSLPLNGIKILDFSHLLPGELCSTILSDLGCDVVRIEPIQPGLGAKLPPLVEGESLYYWSIHRNKKRIALDLKHPQGLEIAHSLIGETDVLLENFRPGVMERLGASYAQAKKLNPKIIYCSISGYGHESSWKDRPGHDLNFLAESGVLDATREDGRPAIPGALVSDYTAALYGALAVVAALFEQRTTKHGRHIDISMFESALSTQQIMATALTYLGLTKEQAHFRYPPAEMPNYTSYECKDGKFIAIAPLEPSFWKIFCQRLGLNDIAESIVNPQDKALTRRLSEIFRQKTQEELLQLFEGANCCVSPVNTLTEALDSVPACERHVLAHLEHPKLGAIPQIASPMLNKQQRRAFRTQVHDNNGEVIKLLKTLGFKENYIKDLCRDGIVRLNEETQ